MSRVPTAGPDSASPVVGALALLIDELVGEPPVRLHPVVAMGAYLSSVDRLVPAEPPALAALSGATAWGAGLLGATAAGWTVDRAADRLPHPLSTLVRAATLSTLLSSRLLRHEVAAVEDALARSVDDGRSQLARLVSRDTSTLGAEQIRGAALSSLAENLCDSVVAPLLAYAVAGLPGAAAYRFVNTADAMWGYRDRRWRYAGTVAARADDLANLLPARLSGVLLLGRRAVSPPGWRLLREQARLTPSPNGGWPMGALALRLGVRLVKPGVYALGAGGRDPVATDTDEALRLVRRAGVAAVVVAGLLGAAVRAVAAPRAGGGVGAVARPRSGREVAP